MIQTTTTCELLRFLSGSLRYQAAICFWNITSFDFKPFFILFKQFAQLIFRRS